MIIKIVKKAAKFLFEKKVSQETLFIRELQKNKRVKNVQYIAPYYSLEVFNLKIVLRNKNHSDYSVFIQIFKGKEYLPIVSYFKNNIQLKNDFVLIDAGANVGFTSLYFLKEFDKIKVFGIEPSQENLELYTKNVALNQFSKKVEFYQNALSGVENKVFTIDNSFRDGKDWALTTQETSNGNIKGITLNEIVAKNNLEYISCLKIDIEGAERFVFAKENDLSFLKITQTIAIEIHDEFHSRNDIYTILKSYGFILFESGELTIGIKSLFNNS